MNPKKYATAVLVACLQWVDPSLSLALAKYTNHTSNKFPVAVTPADRSNGSVISIQATSGLQDDRGVKLYRLVYMSDGLEIVGFLVMPANTEKKLPVLIFNHGGCDNWSKIDGRLLDYLADLSIKGPYIVLASQYRGIDGSQGKDEWCGKDIDDVLNLEPLAKRIPMADTSKFVMLGMSRGGAMTYRAIAAGFPLKAAVSCGGGTDTMQNYEDRGNGMKKVFEDHLGGTPTSVPEAYKLRSAFYWPEKLNIPVLILHGDADDRVSVTEAQKLSAKLDDLKKPHKLVVVKGGDHCLRNNPQLSDQLILEWFAQHTSDSISIPFQKVHNNIYIDVELGNNSGKFLVDTGCTLSAIDESTIGKLGLKTQTEDTSPLTMVRIPSIKLGQLELQNVPFRVRQISLPHTEKDEKILGIIGESILNKFRVTFDFKNQTLILSDVNYDRQDSSGAFIQVRHYEDGSGIIFDAILDDRVKIPCLFDTGASVSLVPDKLIQPLLTKTLAPASEIHGLNGERIKTADIAFSKFQIANYVIENPVFSVKLLKGKKKCDPGCVLENDTFAAVGPNLWGNATVTIDYKNMRMWIEQ